MDKVVILTGAGISAESGISTFRDNNGLWENHAIEDVATPEGFNRNPQLVLHFYNQRRQQLLDTAIQPNPAHKALAKFERESQYDVIIVTQNIDNLHERAGSHNVIHMHGELLKKVCSFCHEVSDQYEDMNIHTPCTNCTKTALRPYIVWFGEMPIQMDNIYAHLEQCTIFAAIGTSGQVYPAAGFVAHARTRGAETWQLNLESTKSTEFHHHLYGKASETVVNWTHTLLKRKQI